MVGVVVGKGKVIEACAAESSERKRTESSFCRLTRKKEMSAACAGRETTCEGEEVMGTASQMAVNGDKSSGEEEAD